MNNIDIFANKLATLKKEVITELEEIAIKHTETDDWEIRTDNIDLTDADENLHADDNEETNERISTLAELETSYRNINLALKKISEGNYGICEICHETISSERLEANPSARTCLTHLEDEASLPLA